MKAKELYKILMSKGDLRSKEQGRQLQEYTHNFTKTVIIVRDSDDKIWRTGLAGLLLDNCYYTNLPNGAKIHFK